jgi:nitroimidazol reductase NimA-like FMN-containing flavoprotein (pyridoxamine 5'-phosphate oxidase superfamily)
MALVTPDGLSYCIPISPVRDTSRVDADVFYFHCAMQGTKTDLLRQNPHVCLCFAGGVEPIAGKFSITFESAVVKGVAAEVLERGEKIHALRILCERYTPLNMANFDAAIAKSLDITQVWRITANEITAKARPGPLKTA